MQLSLDDVYLTRSERAVMAREIHPLFAVRGPPGTHDLDLLERTITALSTAGPDDQTLIPVFDKLADDRAPVHAWRRFAGRPAAILIDGWCLGATVQAAQASPLNALERLKDPDGVWRGAIERFVGGVYLDLASRLDQTVFLRAPGFDVVLDWRCEQEEGLRGRALSPAEREGMAAFVRHFERLTRGMIDGAVLANIVVQLDRNRLPVTVSP